MNQDKLFCFHDSTCVSTLLLFLCINIVGWSGYAWFIRREPVGPCLSKGKQSKRIGRIMALQNLFSAARLLGMDTLGTSFPKSLILYKSAQQDNKILHDITTHFWSKAFSCQLHRRLIRSSWLYQKRVYVCFLV